MSLRDLQPIHAVWTRTPELLRRPLRRLAHPRPVAPASAIDPAVVDPGRVRPLPAGWTREEVFELLATISIEAAPPSELQAYLTEDFERFLLTWGLVEGMQGTALEIGANPYFTTVLIREFTSLELRLTNSFLPDATGIHHQRVAWRDAATGHVAEHVLEYASVNVERTALPYDDDSFDVVLFCEVIEHLLEDPVRALLEMKRVLKPGGSIVVSTPNVARLENVARLVAGANMYDPYSGYGPYGRHNREFTRHELVRLLEFVGFEAEDHFTADVHPHAAEQFADVEVIAQLVAHRQSDLGQYIFCRAVDVGPPRIGRPQEIYRSMAGVSLISWD